MEKVRLGDFATVITKGTTPTSLGYDFIDNGINFVKIESITEDGDFIKDKFAHISDECNEKLNRSKLQENDILFSIAGAIGRVAIVDKSVLPANTNQALAIIRVPEGIYEYNFLKYILKSPMISKQFEKQKQGVAQINLSLKNISDFEIPVISLEQQKQISFVLDKITDLINKRKQQLEKLDELVKARFVELFGDLRINEKEWEIKTFSELAEIITDGEHSTPRRVEKGIYLLSARNVLNHSLQLDDVDYIDEDEYSRISKRIIPRKGDVLISCSGTVGRCCCVPDNLKFQMVRSVAIVRFKNIINPIFAEYMITSDYLQEQINGSKTMSSQANLFQGNIAKLRGFVPPIELQEKFVSFVEQTDKSKLEVQKSLEKLELLKKALMQKYFG